MKKLIFLLSLFVFSCSVSKSDFQKDNKDVVALTILQINDFYEIAPLDNGNIGGAARVATLRKKLLMENPNVLTLLAGDFISPSLLGTLQMDGEKVKGKQMIEALNAIGLDLATFGNHEFDYDLNVLQKRINESKFNWVSSNVNMVKDGKTGPFSKNINGKDEFIPRSKTFTFRSPSGKSLRIGVVAPCLDVNKAKFVAYDDINVSMNKELTALKGQVEFLISLSHLNKEQDIQTAKDFPMLDLILGGHEHENMKYKIGKTVLTKADANVRSAYVHRLYYNTIQKKYKLTSELVKLDSKIALDQQVNNVVEKWKSFELRTIRNMGFNPDEIIPGEPVHYDAREIIIRNEPAAFCKMICKSMMATCTNCDAAIMNSGSVRLDDVLEGKISQYNILQALPYAGSLIELDMTGSLLVKVLNVGFDNKGKGGYLQWDKIKRDQKGQWYIGDNVINQQKKYHIILNDFLLTGMEYGLPFLVKDNPEISNIVTVQANDEKNLRRDIRLAVIDYLKKGGR